MISLEWPGGLVLVMLLISMVAALVPWVVVAHGRRVAISLGLALTATGTWRFYESCLAAIASANPGDPMIRVDLFVIWPALFVTWLAVGVSLLMVAVAAGKRAGYWRGRSADSP